MPEHALNSIKYFFDPFCFLGSKLRFYHRGLQFSYQTQSIRQQLLLTSQISHS